MKLTEAQRAAGIGTFTFKYKHPYSDSGKNNTFSISVNGSNYSSGTLNYTSSTATKTITINAVPNSTSITITITGTARLCVDDFSWTSYASNKTVYLKPTSAWDNSSAKFAVYYFNNSTNTNGWSSLMTKVDDKCNNDVYKAEIPSSYTNLIFVRLNNTATAGDWNKKWDQTADLTLSGTNNMYTISAHGSNGGKASGSWSAYKEEVQVTYDFQKVGIISNITECVIKGQTTANKSYNLLGWKLEGWYKEAACKNQWNFSTTVTSEMTLYAKWSEPATTTVYLNANSNNVNWKQDNADIWVHAFMSSTGEYKDIQLTPVNTCDINWLKAEGIPYGVDKLIFLRVADGAGVVWSGSNLWNQAAEIGYSGSTSYYQMNNWSAVKTATAYQPSTYTISYNSGGGTGSMASTTVECDGSITLPANSFTRTGYTFNGWKDASGKTYTDKSTISNIKSNITLTAQWKVNTYTITSNLTNCSSSPAIPASYTYTGSAANLTYTITPESGYRLPDAITVSGCAYTWDKTTGQLKLTGTISGNVTITIEAVKVYTITWKVNKQTYTTGSPTQSIDAGKTYKNLTLPTAPANNTLDECYSGKKFVGWSTTNIGSAESDKPSILFKSTSEAPNTAIPDNTTLYAVFATESTTDSGSEGWGKVTSTADLKAGDIYAISSAATGGTYLSTYTGGNNYPASSTIICKLELGGSSGAWTFKIADGSTYNNYYLTATSTTGSNHLKAVSTVDNYSKFTISFSSNAAVITCTGKSSRNILRYNGSNNPPIFSCYSSGQSAVYLQKYNAGTTTETTGYVTECCTLNNITLDGSGTTTGGTFSATATKACKGEEITLTATAAECYEFVSWTIKKTSDGTDVTNSVLNDNTLTMPDYAVTVYATFKSLSVTEIALSMTGGHKNLDVGDINQLLVTYTPADATCDTEIDSWTSSDDNVMSVTDGLVKALRAGNATITATTKGGVTATYTITVNSPACDSWYIHYWNNSTSGDECFYKVKPDDPNDHEWRTNNFSLPSFSDEDKFIVNNTPEDPYKTDQVFRTGIGFADIQRGGQNCGTNPYPGQDAYGQLSIYDDSETDNRYIAFYPAQYLVTYGKKDGAAPWEVLPLNNTTGYEYETEPFMVPNGYKTDDTYKYYVGITDKNGNIKYVGYEFDGVEYKKSSVDAMNTVNGLSTSNMAGKWGVWHIWSNSCANNWYAEFIRYYRVDFDLAGGEGDIAPRYGKAAEPYVTFSTTDITAPTRDGYTFLGWKDQNGKSYNPTESTVTINDDLTLTAQWAKHHIVTYDANEGTTRCEDDNIYIEGDEVKVCADQPTQTGYTFDGWIRSDNDKRVKEDETFTMPDEDVTLTAQWIINQYTVTLNPNYPAGKTGTFTYEEGELVDGNLVLTYDYNTASKKIADLYTSLTLDGYEFGGWYNAKGVNPGEVSGSPCTNTDNITGDKTYYAKWTKLYSITLSENGTTTELEAQTSISYTLPTELSVGTCENDEKALVGWSTVAIPTPGDKPASKFYELGETVTLTADQTTFYAVFATVAGGGVENVDATLSFESTAQRTSYSTSEQVWEQNGITLTNDKASSTSNVGDYANPARFYKSSDITIEAPGKITKIVFNCSESKYTTSIAGFSADGTTITVTQDGTSTTFSTNLSEGQVRLNSLVVTYTTNGGTTYSDYTTTCVKLPDPVLSFATEPANPIVFTDAVCGGNSSKQSVTVIGENLRDVVNVSVAGPYKIARTSSTALNAFTTSLTLDKTAAGAIHSNYQTVYIISTPPAQSTEATTGTLTFTTTKGNTLTVNLSTPTVTCTQYTLTLVDRGVSTEQPTKYYAGETIDEAPADPEGVCTDPIHYVFDGWAAATVAAGATTYTKVTFPHTVTGNTKFYAVYRYVEEGSADSGDYVKLTEDLDDYSGDYLIVYEAGNVAFDGGLDELDETENTIAVTISNNTIESNATTDAAKFTIAKVDGGYSIKSASGYYIGWGGEKNGLNTNSSYTVNYLNTITDKSTICGKTGYLKFNKTSGQERFRYYKSGQETIALYRKAASYLYTTSPVCGPHLVITEGKEIYVTGGNAGGTRDLVMASQKVSYQATRLKTQDGSPEGTAPDVKVAINGITKGGVVTTEVKVTFENTVKELQPDDTYTITGDIVVTYEADANNMQEDIQVQLAVDYPANADARDNFIVHARSLPEKFVIVAKQGDKWYALNADMSSSKAQPANGQVTLNDLNNPTEATYAPCNAIYTFEAMPQGAEDRKSVRFIGMENKYLWAASEGNNGVQNYSKAPAADALAYNWKLYTEDNITYHFGNAQNTRMLGLHSTNVAFGMYANGASVVQDIRILPYVEKCIYNYAPTNLTVTDLKGTHVTLTWDAVVGATKYQYSDDATNWTDCGTEPTVTITGLRGGTTYTYYIRAYHEDAGVRNECIDFEEITFTTADCDDVPTNISYSADLSTITVTWMASSATSTVKLYSDKEGTIVLQTIEGTNSVTFEGLIKNTQYYVQVFGGGSCASAIIPAKTKDVEMDVVEWMEQGIIVDVNTNEKIGVTLENEVAFGTGVGKKAEDIFFSKYFEANGTAKILAIYNGTDEKIDLSTVSILNDLSSQSLDLAEFGHKEVGYIYPNEEIILFNKGVEAVTECSEQQDSYPDWYNVEHGVLNFGGRATLILKRGDAVIDIIGSIQTKGTNYPNDLVGTTIYNIAKSPTGENEKPSWGDDPGWVCESGDNIMTDVEETDYPLSTNRCLLVRKNTVVSGVNAVTNNIDKVFATLCDEWVGLQIPKNAPSTDKGVTESCEGMAFVGDFDYSSYYTQYVPIGGETTFEENQRNPDGTLTVPITDLYKQACRNIKVTLKDEHNEVIMTREYKVPIMITTDQATAYTEANKDDNAFYALQYNLATIEVDENGDEIARYPLTIEQVREICKTCDVVIRDNATLTKAADDDANDHPQVNNVFIYEGASLVIPNGTNETITSLSLRRKGDIVASAKVEEGGNLHLPASATAPIYLDMRIDANNWHWFTLPYNCNIADVTWVDGTPAQYNKDWFIMYYDGNSRANEQSIYENHWKVYNGTTIEAGKGYIVGIQGDITHPDYTFELRFPMTTDVLTNEHINKTVAVNAWGVNMDITPNKKGWNLVGNPYLDYYKTSKNISFTGLSLIEYLGIDPITGERLYQEGGNVPFLVTPVDGGWYEYQQELASDVEMMPFTAYFVQVGDPANASHTDGMQLLAEFVSDHRGRMSLIRRAPQEVDGEQEPVFVRVEVANAKGESDKTTLIIDDRFTNEYEMNGDFFKWFGDYYRRYTKPVLYSMGADQGKRAFNALSEQLAAQPVALGMFAAQAGDYTFSLTRKRCDLSRVEEVWLYDATTATYTNLMQQDYTFTTAKTEGEGRFYLSVKLRQNAPTDITDIYGGNIVASVKDGQIIVGGLTDNTQLWIYDATGKLLHTEQTTNFQHVYEAPVAGTYFVRTQVAGQSQTIKVLVE